MTSNYNEAIHSLLFRMVRKTEACGMDTMKLASALAIIRYNDGFAGIKNLYESLGIEVSDRMKDNFARLDSFRVSKSFYIIPQQKKRFLMKQNRGKKLKKKINKLGKGYSSNAYSAARKLFPDENSDHSDFEEEIVTDAEAMRSETNDNIIYASEPSSSIQVATSSMISNKVDSCELCGGTDANRLVGFGTRARFRKGDIDWLNCKKCKKWFHLFCLGLEKQDGPEEEWFCDYC